MSTKQIQALVHRWPSTFVDKLKTVANDQMTPVNSLVYNLIRREVESEYKRIKSVTANDTELEESR